MVTAIERVKIALYAIAIHFGNKFVKHRKTNRILIVFQQILGDAVVFLKPLEEYSRFSKENNMQLTILCKPIVLGFWQSVANLPDNICIETIDYTRLFNDFSYFRTELKKYRNYADIVIAPGSTLSSDLFSSVLCANRRIGMVGHKRINWPPHIAIFQRIAFSEMVFPDLEMMMIQRHRFLLHYLGRISYMGQTSELKTTSRIIKERYAVICPGASLIVKCWPIERYAEIADWLIDNYHIEIYLCGGNEENEIANKLLSLSSDPSHIHSFVGITTFEDWLSIVQYAEVVIGNDSATLHIAAATNRKALCIAGVYDKFQFFPYKVDYLGEKQRIPETIYIDIPCENCKSKGYFHGYGNKECLDEIKKGRCALCISKIKTEDVKERLKKMLS